MRISDWSSDVCSSDLLAAIDALGIETIIDLRGDDEREAHPCRRSGNFAGRVLFADGITAGLAPHLQAAGGAIDVGTARARMIDTYADDLFLVRGHVLMICGTGYVEVIAATGDSVRVQTASGARTGLYEIGRAHVCTPVTNAHLVCR